MGDVIKIPQMIILFEGIYDFNKLYSSIYDWLTKRGYGVKEPKYKNKTTEIEISWVASRSETTEIKFKFDIYFHIWALSKVSIKMGDSIIQQEKSRLRININPSIEVFPADTFGESEWDSKTFFITKLKQFIQKHGIKKMLDSTYKKKIRNEEIHLHQFIKEILNIDAKNGAY